MDPLYPLRHWPFDRALSHAEVGELTPLHPDVSARDGRVDTEPGLVSRDHDLERRPEHFREDDR
jgi:hypothetical protein